MFLLFLYLMATTSIVSLSGCKDDDENAGTADFKVSMSNTIAPSRSYSEVNVDVVKISINVSSDTNTTGGWFDLPTNQGVYNLLDYVAGNDTILAFDPVLAVQTINQVRLILGPGNTIVDNGVTYPLDTPSGQTSGLKIPVNVTLQPGAAYILQLDFDPYESVVKTGNNNYKLKPVIRATVVPL